MRGYDLVSSLFFSVCGLLIAVGSLGMPIGRLGEPGPGFLPLFIGLLMGILSLALFIRSYRAGISEKKAFWIDRKQWPKVFATILALMIYAFALRGLGFALVTLLLLVFLFKVIGELSWRVSIIGPLLTTSFFYLLFKVWLEVQLPEGPFGI
jgi:putative tricarboxylic transport membrane protein